MTISGVTVALRWMAEGRRLGGMRRVRAVAPVEEETQTN